jgi:TatD DNase family protein
LQMGFYIGVGGVVTFKNGRKLKETVRQIPLERIVLETDSPYMAPEPNRGKRNASPYLRYVAQTIAEIKGITAEEVKEQTWKNAHRLYRI